MASRDTVGGSTQDVGAEAPLADYDATRLLHELRVHQVELELQNEVLTKTRAELAARLQQYTELYDLAPVGYFTLSADGTIRQTNMKGASMLGAERQSLVGQHLGCWVADDHRGVFAALLTDLFGGTRQACELVLDTTAGPAWVHMEGSASVGPHECCVGAVDISLRKRAEEEKDQFLALCSHELRTPLTVVQANVDLLIRAYSTLEEASRERLLTSLHSQVRKLGRIVADLLEVTRMSTGHVELALAPVRMGSLVRTAAEAFRQACATHSIALNVASDCTVLADAGRLEQVVTNLLSNAARYSPAGSGIEVSFRTDGVTASASITDHGRGIHETDFARIFERYYRTSEARGEGSGLGIGLSVCKDIAALHNGAIRVQSSIGEGSTFTLEVPVSA